MKKKLPPILSIYNHSSVLGGQERYLKNLADVLLSKKILVEFMGTPRGLISHRNGLRNEGAFKIELLNGNRALYKRGWRHGAHNIRVYVQHSHIHDGQSHPAKRWFRKILLRLFLSRMDIVVRVCNDALPDFYAPGKIHTIYNGVSIPNCVEFTRDSRSFTILMVGSVNDNKNQILALRLLVEQADLRLIVVGDGPRLKEWQQWACDAGVDSRVSWTGFVDAPEQYYGQADALLLLSEFEAFPYVMLEAMAHALPVVATRVGGVPEAITHEKDGLLLPRRDLNALSEAVSRLKNNREWAQQLGQQARRTVSERFTVEKMTDNLLALIESAARKKGLIQ
jgi:L-malate glycosyltransferase